MALTDKQQRFADEYLIDLNATQAAIRAGYSAKNADKIGSQLLGKTGVQAEIQKKMKAREGRTNIKADRVLRELARVGFSDVGEVLDFDRENPHLRPANTIPEDARRAIASVKVRRFCEGTGDAAREVELTEFKLWDKLAALDKIARHLGMLKDRVEVTGADGGPVEVKESVVDRIDQLTAAFSKLADRQGEGGAASDGAGK